VPDLSANHLGNTHAELRGPLLAAHRALRQAVNARRSAGKGELTVALLAYRENRGDVSLRDNLQRLERTMRELHVAMVSFGGPELVPQYSGFADYLAGREQHVRHTLACAATAGAESEQLPEDGADDRQRHLANLMYQGRYAGQKEFAQMFETAFKDVLASVRST
jgi:hypothetical protein